MKKACARCGKRKSISEFYKAKTSTAGYFGACKLCVKQRVADHRAKNLDRIRADDKIRSARPERREALARRVLAIKEKYPERYVARYTLHNAVTSGKVKKPKKCGYVACPEKKKFLIEAHHEDYAYPLDVKWLCTPCHARVHTGTTPAARAIQAVIAVPLEKVAGG